MSACDIDVYRFAHRPSIQPLLAQQDLEDAAATHYLATQSVLQMLVALLRVTLARPTRMAGALREFLRLRRAGTARFGHVLLACLLTERLREAKVDCLHVHFAMSSAVVAMLARQLGGPPYTLAVHGPEEFEAARSDTLEILVRASSATVAVSNWAARFVAQVTGVAHPPVRIIRMGVDDVYLSKPKCIDPFGAVLCVARLDSRKGHQVLFEALASIPIDQRALQVQLIGDGPMRRELERDVSRLGLSEHVSFLGWLSQDEIVAKLDACRFLVLPSLDEGLPVVLMEAFSRSRPVIATDVGAIQELVAHGLNGFVVKVGDADELKASHLSNASISPRPAFQYWGVWPSQDRSRVQLPA